MSATMTIETPRQQEQNRLADEVLAVVTDIGFATIEDLLFEVGGNPTSVMNAVWKLVETGKIVNGTDGIVRAV